MKHNRAFNKSTTMKVRLWTVNNKLSGGSGKRAGGWGWGGGAGVGGGEKRVELKLALRWSQPSPSIFIVKNIYLFCPRSGPTCIKPFFLCEQKKKKKKYIQSNLVISNSLISNYRLSRSENLVPVLTWTYDNRWQNNVEKRRNCNFSSFPHYFIFIFLTPGDKLHIHLLNVVVQFIVFLTLSTLICRGKDISKYFGESLGIWDNESRLY